MKKVLLIASALTLMISGLFAGVMDGPGAPALKEKDIIAGARLAIGSVYGANTGVILSGEYGLKEGFLGIPNFPTTLGIGASIGYSGYSVNRKEGEYRYSNYFFMASGSWHIDLLKKKEVDTYVVVNLGINLDNVSKPAAQAPEKGSKHGGITVGSGAGIKYYLSSRFAVLAEAGFGMGFIRFGLDLKL